MVNEIPPWGGEVNHIQPVAYTFKRAYSAIHKVGLEVNFCLSPEPLNVYVLQSCEQGKLWWVCAVAPTRLSFRLSDKNRQIVI